MATLEREFGDISGTAAVRRAFLEAVVREPPPIRARNLRVAGLDRRAIQKRLERLRNQAGGRNIEDEALLAYARDELSRLAGPTQRGLLHLRELANPAARLFAEEAGLQSSVIGDWVELAHSPADRGWTRSQIAVEELSRGSSLIRGRSRGWLLEKKRYLSGFWTQARSEPQLQRNLVPNQLKVDLARLTAPGTEDAPRCAI
jgi:hypothetical protein